MSHVFSQTSSEQLPASAAVIADVMTRTGQGDVAAFEQLYSLTIGKVTATARAIVIDREQTEEVVQEVYLELWRCADRFDPSRGAALPWLLRIVKHRSIDRVRHCEAARAHEHAYIQTGDGDVPGDLVLEQVLRAEKCREVRDAVGQLTDRQRQTVWLTYFDHWTGPQISAHLDLPLGTVKSRLRDGLLGLRAAMASALQ